VSSTACLLPLALVALQRIWPESLIPTASGMVKPVPKIDQAAAAVDESNVLAGLGRVWIHSVALNTLMPDLLGSMFRFYRADCATFTVACPLQAQYFRADATLAALK
jgi:hypothetical protein